MWEALCQELWHKDEAWCVWRPRGLHSGIDGPPSLPALCTQPSWVGFVVGAIQGLKVTLGKEGHGTVRVSVCVCSGGHQVADHLGLLIRWRKTNEAREEIIVFTFIVFKTKEKAHRKPCRLPLCNMHTYM